MTKKTDKENKTLSDQYNAIVNSDDSPNKKTKELKKLLTQVNDIKLEKELGNLAKKMDKLSVPETQF